MRKWSGPGHRSRSSYDCFHLQAVRGGTEGVRYIFRGSEGQTPFFSGLYSWTLPQTSCDEVAGDWNIGRAIAKWKQRKGWGSAVIPHLARDLRNKLPEVKRFSERNIKLMTQFYCQYPSLGAHNVLLMQKVKDLSTRLWYLR